MPQETSTYTKDRRTQERFGYKERRQGYRPIDDTKGRQLRETDPKEVFSFHDALNKGNYYLARAFANLIKSENPSQSYSYLIISYAKEIEVILNKIKSMKKTNQDQHNESELLMNEARKLLLISADLIDEIAKNKNKGSPPQAAGYSLLKQNCLF